MNCRFPIIDEPGLNLQESGFESDANMTFDRKLHAAVTLTDFASSGVIDSSGARNRHSDRR
jgi:hypothetical protein